MVVCSKAYALVGSTGSENKVVLERTSYTLFTLIADVGGFNGAIILFPSYFLSWYSARQFQSAVYVDTIVKKKKKRNTNQYLQNQNSRTNLREKLAKLDSL